MFNDFIGFGSLGEALQSLSEKNHAKVFVVASVSGWERFNSREKRNFFVERAICLFNGFSANPDISEIMAGVAEYRAFAPDLIVAFGGGSPIDVAKMIKVIAHAGKPYDPSEPSAVAVTGDGPPLVAIPTTAGSGSEATQFAVFYRGEAKQSIAHPSIRPEIAVVDPELTYSLGAFQTAATGFDALSQAVEAVWSASTNDEALRLASSAVRYARDNLEKAVSAPDPGSRYHMAQAAYLAGMAINITRTTLPHALAYHLTKRYGLAHGHAVALTLPYFFALNTEPGVKVTAPFGLEAHRRNMDAIFALLDRRDAGDAFRWWRERLAACGLAASLQEAGLTTREQIATLVATANPERAKNHPVAIAPERLIEAFLAF